MDLQACRAAAVTTMEHSAVLATAAAGGVLQRPVQRTPGPATWAITVAVSAGATTVRKSGFLFVASGINLFDSFDNLIIYTPSVERILK